MTTFTAESIIFFAKTFKSYKSSITTNNTTQVRFQKESDAKEFSECMNWHYFYNNSLGGYSCIQHTK